jgi:hypothetical protein
MTFNFRDELDGLASRVAEHPYLEVLAYRVNPPATAKLVQRCEREFGTTLPSSLAEFYRKHNGASLQWRFKEDLDDAQRDDVIVALAPLTPVPEYAFDLAGAINILPVEDFLLHEDYTVPQVAEEGDEVVFDNNAIPLNDFFRSLRIFDATSDDGAMAFVALPDSDDWKMMWLTANWAAYYMSRVTCFDDYLRLIIATWGLLSARDSLFVEYEGYLAAPIVFSDELVETVIPDILR